MYYGAMHFALPVECRRELVHCMISVLYHNTFCTFFKEEKSLWIIIEVATRVVGSLFQSIIVICEPKNRLCDDDHRAGFIVFQVYSITPKAMPQGNPWAVNWLISVLVIKSTTVTSLIPTVIPVLLT